MTVPAGSAQQAQIIQTSDGQAIVYPIQVDGQGNILHQQSTGKYIYTRELSQKAASRIVFLWHSILLFPHRSSVFCVGSIIRAGNM